MREKHKNIKDLEKIFKSIEDQILNDSDFAQEYLNESGYDLDELNKKGLDFIEKIKGKARLEIAKQNKNKFIEEIKNYLNQASSEIREKSREAMIEILKSKQKEQLSFQFRNFEKFSTDDLVEMISEEELLSYFEKLRKGKE